MVQLRSILTAADNSGAKRLRVIHIHGGSKRRFAYLGGVITAVIDQVSSQGTVKDSQIVKAVIVRAKKEKKRRDGSYIRFDDNAAVIIDGLKSKNPLGTRVFGPIGKEVKENGFSKIASLAKEVL